MSRDGVPKFGVANKNPTKQDSYSLKEEEFYTLVSSNIYDFIDDLVHEEDFRQYVEKRNLPEATKEIKMLMDEWINERSKFFKDLKEFDSTKYKKASKLFYSEVYKAFIQKAFPKERK